MSKWNGKYKIIYADPPWEYKCWNSKNNGGGRGMADEYYNTMTLQDIKNLDVKSICDDECCLFMWVTAPFLDSAFEVMKAWGFEYITIGFTWIKQNKKSDSLFWGMGHYTRANTELCLLGRKIKGKCPKVKQHNVHSVIISPISRHSEKPNEARERITQLFGNIPRIELFAREKRKGWHVFGNEVESDVKL